MTGLTKAVIRSIRIAHYRRQFSRTLDDIALIKSERDEGHLPVTVATAMLVRRNATLNRIDKEIARERAGLADNLRLERFA